MTKVAVVILNWNGKELLEKFLPLVVDYTVATDVKVVVADNASTDDSLAFLRSTYPELDIIALSENYGFAEGYNKALSQVDAEYYVLLNSDVEVTEGWLSPMLEYMEKNRDVAAVQPKILSQRNKLFFEYAGASGGFIDKLGFPFCRGRIFDALEVDNGQYDDVIDVFWASGACMLIRAKDYWQVGGLDGRFFAHMEEIDLCWRLNARGRKIICVPQSEVYHVGGATLDEESAHKVYLNFRNNMLMLYKNLADEDLNKTINLRKIYNWVAVVKFILSGRMDKAKSIFRAHKDFDALREEYSTIRSENLKQVTVKDVKTIYQGNIVKDYYLMGKKTFKDLLL